ncbi:MAG: SRPBCC family protein [Thermoanaerobaculia bacterium]|nr:SRPBCC family protein [Thermoanaerobaculia bacterium]
MPRYLRVVWLLLGLGSLVALVLLLLLPADWEVERETVIHAPPEAIWDYLVDLRRWESWSPWREGDYEGLRFEYTQDSRGTGAELRWSSEATGDGRLRITETEPPRRLELLMEMQEGTIVTREILVLQPLTGGRTRVQWHDRGTLGHTLLGRLSLPVIEESMGRDLSRGLQDLREVVEGADSGTAEPNQSPEPAESGLPQRDAT